MPSRIEDYALIGDCQTAALVGRDGSIDWLCFPRFDSGACFAALLGTPEHGRWLLAPAGEVRAVRRRYRDGTLVLETEFETDDGAVTVIDFMPPRADVPDLVRIVEGRRGRVADADGAGHPLRLRLDRPVGPAGRAAGSRRSPGPDMLRLRTDVELQGEDLTTVAEFAVAEGQRVPFVLTWHPSHEPAPRPLDAERGPRRHRALVARVVGPLHLPRASGARRSCGR